MRFPWTRAPQETTGGPVVTDLQIALYENDPCTVFNRYVIGVEMPKLEYKVGQVITVNGTEEVLKIRELPEGTKLYHPNGSIVARDGGSPWMILDGDYIILELPEKDLIQELAERLWEVRNDTLDAEGFSIYSGEMKSIHEKVYRALAEAVAQTMTYKEN